MLAQAAGTYGRRSEAVILHISAQSNVESFEKTWQQNSKRQEYIKLARSECSKKKTTTTIISSKKPSKAT